MKKKIFGIFTLILIFTFFVNAEEKFFLQYKFKNIKNLVYSIQSRVFEEVEMLKLYQKIERTSVTRIKQVVKKVGKDEGYLIETYLLGGVMEVNGKKHNIYEVNTPARMLIKPNGKVLYTSDLYNLDMWNKMNAGFPKEKVYVGKKWTVKKDVEMGQMAKFRSSVYKAKFKVSKITNINGRRCAVIDSMFTIKPKKKEDDYSFEIVGKTRQIFDINNGILVKNQATYKINIKGYSNETKDKSWVKVFDYTMNVRMDMKLEDVNVLDDSKYRVKKAKLKKKEKK